MERVDVLGVNFDTLTMSTARDNGEKLLGQKNGSYVVTPNPEIVFAARKDGNYARALAWADLVLADGIGIVYAARILGRPSLEKIPGIEFGRQMLSRCAETGLAVYLLGGKPGVAQRAAANLEAEYPGLKICGTHDGYFGPEEPVAELITASGADMVFVCLGFPKQEFWMAENSKKTGASLHIGLGGSLDVFAGDVKRAPRSWQKLGLEWLYRLICEPRRIKRMWKLPFFLALAVWERLTGG